MDYNPNREFLIMKGENVIVWNNGDVVRHHGDMDEHRNYNCTTEEKIFFLESLAKANPVIGNYYSFNWGKPNIIRYGCLKFGKTAEFLGFDRNLCECGGDITTVDKIILCDKCKDIKGIEE